MSFSLDTWIVTQGGSQETEIKQHDSLAHPLLISVQDPFGEVMHPTPRNLAEAQLAQDVEQPRDPELHSLLVVASQTSAATFVNIDGGRIAKVEYIEGIAAKILSFGRKSSALFVACRDGGMIAYSLPHLELLFQHKPLPSEGPFGTCSISPDGEFLDFHGPAFISILSTFAAGRGQAPPDVVAFDPSLDMPSLPTMPGNMISSWWNSQVRLTPDSLDALLAGPDRKPKQVTSNARPQRKEARPKTVSEEYEFEDARPAVNETNRMLMERGNALNHLNDTFNAISQNSKEMIAEARQMAVQQAAKDKFTKMFF